MAKREAVEYERTKAPVTVKCEQCGRAIGKGKPVRLWREEETCWRGDDVMHWRCPECHAEKVKAIAERAAKKEVR